MKTLTLAAAAALALGCALPAVAQTHHHRHHTYRAYGDYDATTHARAYLTGGLVAPSGSLTRLNGVAGVVSMPLHHFNVFPGARPQVSLEAPITNNRGRYALTGEEVTRGNTFVGLGVGIGRLEVAHNNGLVWDVIAGTKVAPNTALVGRFYLSGSNGAGTTGMLGLRIGLP